MTDMLVKLYELPALEPHLERARAAGVDIRRALPPEKHHILAWIRERFGEAWVSEADVSCNAKPPTCFVAVRDGALLGFSCYDATGLGMFGPIGVDEAARGTGVGAALLVACLHAMAARGYFYAVIGGVGPAEFYAKTVGAVEIPDSTPGPYRGMLRDPHA
jgi:GNAT superfamily N-acetyltransferase